MQTTAREIVDKLNEYEATHTPPDYDIWYDVIRVLPEYDEEGTAMADPDYWGDIVVLTDGTYVERRENEWVIA